jgi:hypothetical protein
VAEPLLALSFLQPWLWAILERHKGIDLLTYGFLAIENRTWRPPSAVIGERIALHASAGWDPDGEEFIDERLIIDLPPGATKYVESPPKTQCTRGAIVGTAMVLGATLVAGGVSVGVPGIVVERTIASPWAFGPWCWVLFDVRKLAEPIPAKGRLGLWPVASAVAARVRDLEAPRG